MEMKTTGLIFCDKNKPKSCRFETTCLLKKNLSSSPICICVQTGEPLLEGNRRCETKKSENHDFKGSKIRFKLPISTSLPNAKNRSKSMIVSDNATKDYEEVTSVSYPIHDVQYNATNFTSTINEEAIVSVANPSIFPLQYWFIGGPISIIFLVILLYVVGKCYMPHFFGSRRKKCHENKVVVVPLEKSILTEERYTSNPQYTPTSVVLPTDVSTGLADLGLPILSRNSITNLQKIGEGFFGEVYKGELHSMKNDEECIEAVAVKMLKKTAAPQVLEDFLREVEIISSFQHPNILTMIGVCGKENSSSPWMVFEFMKYGDLADVLRNSGAAGVPTLSLKYLLSISLQIAKGMEYLASQRFVHRDLACRNCLVGSELTVKISDFGMSRDVYTCDYYRMGGSRMLPVRWMSPESMTYGKFTLESDVWSFGVVLWEIFSSGKQPYYGYTNEQVLKFIVEGKLLTIPNNCPREVADIMTMCWKDLKERIHFLDICNRLSNLIDSVDEVDIIRLPRPPPILVTVNYPLSESSDHVDGVDVTEIVGLPRPPPMPVTVNYPLSLHDDELDNFDDDDNDDDDDYLGQDSSSSLSLVTYIEMLPP